nr:retrotransposable element Tf2 [Tanacetum cinerariifolium]
MFQLAYDVNMNRMIPQLVIILEEEMCTSEAVPLQAEETKLEYSSRSPKIFSIILDFIHGQTDVVNRCLECYLRCMTSEKPKEWVQWLALAEFWYNTNFHTAIQTTPYEAVYGQKPLVHAPYMLGESAVEQVDRTLQARQQALNLIKFHLIRAQDRMRNFANKHMTDRDFDVGM